MLGIHFYIALSKSYNKLGEVWSLLHDLHEEIEAWKCEMPFSRPHSSFVIDPGFKGSYIHTNDNISLLL